MSHDNSGTRTLKWGSPLPAPGAARNILHFVGAKYIERSRNKACSLKRLKLFNASKLHNGNNRNITKDNSDCEFYVSATELSATELHLPIH